jgi:hypothetical protein
VGVVEEWRKPSGDVSESEICRRFSTVKSIATREEGQYLRSCKLVFLCR